MKLGLVVLAVGVLGQQALAVTPAHLAMRPVKAFLDARIERMVAEALPDHEEPAHLIQFQTQLMRGKYSSTPGGFSDYFGDSTVMVQIGETGTYYEVGCHFSASAIVVPFAKQLVPVLEETVNEQQLILRRHQVSCRLN